METPNRTDVESTIITNLVLAGLLLPSEVARYTMALARYNANELSSQMQESNQLLGQSLEAKAMEARN